MKRDNAEILFLSFLFVLPLVVNFHSLTVEDAKLYALLITSFLLCFTRGFFKWNWAFISTILLLLLGMVIAITSDDVELSFLGSDKRHLGYIAWFAAGILGLKIAQLNEDEKLPEKITKCLVFSGTLSAIAAMILGYFELGLFDGRIGGTMGNPNALGELLCVTIFLTLTKIRNPKYIPLVLIQVPAFIWTGNRMSWIALAISLVLYINFIRKNLKLSLLTLAIVVSIAVFGYQRFFDITSVNTRLDIYNSAFSIIKENPFGYGFDQIETILTPEHFTLKADRAHQMYLDTAINMGIGGMILLIVITVRTFQELIRKKDLINKSLAFAFLTLVLSLQTSFFTVTHLALFFMFMGLAAKKN